MNRQTLWRLAATLAFAVAVAPAQARNTNGVYLDFDPNLDRDDRWARAEVRYACHGGGGWKSIEAEMSRKHCKRGANIEVRWYENMGPGKTDPNPGLESFSVDDSNSDHCGIGEAVIWLVAGKAESGTGKIGSTVKLDPDCLYCAYTGGPCE